MKRPSDDDGERSSNPQSRLEGFLSAFLQKHPRFFLYSGIALVLVIIIAALIAKFTAGT